MANRIPWLVGLGSAILLSAGLLAGPSLIGSAATGDPLQTLIENCSGSSCSRVGSLNSGNGDNSLLGVATAGADTWAVGYSIESGSRRTLIERNKGAGWTIVDSPNVSNQDNQLNSVSGVPSGDVWAVGYRVSGNQKRTLIEHWNGSQWKIAPSPNRTSSDNVLLGVFTQSAVKAYAVGYSTTSNGTKRTLVEEHNGPGTNWKIVTSPNRGAANADNVLNSVHGNGTRVWAVGSYQVSGSMRTLAEFKEASGWQLANSANASGQNVLLDVYSDGDAWAVGYHDNPHRPLTEHFETGGWKVKASPDASTPAQLNGVVSLPGGELWVVGFSTKSGAHRTLIARRLSGGSWKVITSPNNGSGDNQLADIDGTAADLWAVGSSNVGVPTTSSPTRSHSPSPRCSGADCPSPSESASCDPDVQDCTTPPTTNPSSPFSPGRTFTTSTPPPSGGVNTGAGGTSPRQLPLTAFLIALGLLMLAGTLFAIRRLPKN